MLHSITQSANYKWWVFGSIAIGTFLSVVDHGSVSVALPDIESRFDSNLATVQWVVLGYALAISVFLLPMGRLGDIIGRKPVYIGGFAIFVLFSALAGLSTNLPTLVGAKVLQGAGSAMIQGTGMATIISAFPASERGKALGYHISIVGVGAIAGPALGGLLTSTLGWRWVFFINVPIGLISIAASLLILGRGRSAPETQGGPAARLRLAGGGAVRRGFAAITSGSEQWPSDRLDPGTYCVGDSGLSSPAGGFYLVGASGPLAHAGAETIQTQVGVYGSSSGMVSLPRGWPGAVLDALLPSESVGVQPRGGGGSPDPRRHLCDYLGSH